MDFDIDRISIMKSFPSPTGDIIMGHVKDGLKKVIDSLQASSILLVADENTAQYCLPLLSSNTISGLQVIVTPGETKKSLESCQQIWSSLLHAGVDRSGMVLNVGGGMVCDLGGFAASCYQRGIRFGHIPTSLLAMADAAIGGKTGVNFEGYKNYIGHFGIPAFIWIDPAFLKTLPDQDIRDGLAEIVKHAIIGGRSLWDSLLKIEDTTSMDWINILEPNTLIKQHIIEADPFEKGLRKILNFGHTIGHALESHFLYSSHPLSHGQAVTLGMLAESKLANLMGLLQTEDFQAIIDLIQRLLRPSELTLPAYIELQHWLEGDKKMSMGSVGYSLPDRIGSCGWNIKPGAQYVVESLDWLSTQVKAG